MSAIGHHVTIRLTDARPIATSAAARRILSHCIYRNASSRGLSGFRAADTHVHLLLAGERKLARAAARCVELSLQAALRPGVHFERARVRTIRDQNHLRNTLAYLFRQEQHHRLDLDPFHDASSLPEMLGMRVLDDAINWRATVLRARALVPRLQRSDLLRLLNLGTPEGVQLWTTARLPTTRQLWAAAGIPTTRFDGQTSMQSVADPHPSVSQQQLRDAIAAAAGLSDLRGADRHTSLARAAAIAVFLPPGPTSPRQGPPSSTKSSPHRRGATGLPQIGATEATPISRLLRTSTRRTT
jgi:hypothetical protein